MNDKDYLRQRLKELDEKRKAKGIQRPNFNELKNSENLDNSNSSKKSNDNNNVKFASKSSINSKFNDGLNLNNSSNLKNQNSTQTQNNKISNKRDYDKEPIIIKDNNLRLFLFCGLLAIVIILLTWNLFQHRQSFAHTSFIACIAASAYFFEFKETANSRYIIFKNSHIEYVVNSIIETKIQLNEITSINKTFSIKYKRYGGMLYNKFAIVFILLSLIAVILNAILFDKIKEMFFIFAMLVTSIFIPKILLWLSNGGKLYDYKIFDAIVVKSENNFINILPINLENRRDIKKYFLIKTGKNINKTSNVLFIL